MLLKVTVTLRPSSTPAVVPRMVRGTVFNASYSALFKVPPEIAATLTVGATVSTTIGRLPRLLTLPAASVAVALRVSAPSPMAAMSAATRA